MGAGEAEISSCSLQIRLPLALNGHMAAESSANLEQFTRRQMRERSVVTPGGAGEERGQGDRSEAAHLPVFLSVLPPSRPRATRPPLSLHFLSQLLLKHHFVFVFLFHFNQLIVSTVLFCFVFLSRQRGAFDE